MDTLEKENDRNIAELASDYVETYVQLAVLNINKKTADISAAASFSMLAGMIGFFVVMFLGIAGSFWVGGMVGSTAAGFLIVSAFYLLVFLVLFLTRKKLFYPFVKNLIIKSIYE
jgi:apolipoprotein N-acyltransferase